MSTSLTVKAYSTKDNKEFNKHLNAVKFCLENELSFPKETSEFFKGKLGGDDLEDIKRNCILIYLENGIEVPLNVDARYQDRIIIKVSEIPLNVDEIVISIS